MNTIMNKVVIVTGASSGIGKQTALRFLREGYEVHAGARRLDAMRDLEQQGAHLHALDLTKGESIDAFVAEVVAQSSRIDVLVNIAGNGPYRELAEATAHLFMAQGASAPPHVIADVIWRAASTRHPQARYAAPFSAHVILGLHWALSDRLFDWVWGRVMGIPATVGSRQ